MIQSLGCPPAPESPDTFYLDAKTLHRQVRTHAIGFVNRERSPITLLAMAANSAAVPEDRRGPITGLPSGVDYTCIKRFSYGLCDAGCVRRGHSGSFGNDEPQPRARSLIGSRRDVPNFIPR